MQFPGAPESLRLREVVRGLVDHLVSGLIVGTADACAGLRNATAVRHAPVRVARYTKQAAETNRQLKELLRANVYNSEMVLAARRESTGKVAELFAYLLEHPDAMPQAYREETAGIPVFRAVCDYIAGMTDRFFERTYRQAMGQNSSSALST